MAMSPELEGARANAHHVELVGYPMSNDVALAKAIQLIIQHLVKRD